MINVLIDRRRVTATPLFQWDRGQVLEVYGLSLAAAPEVHFAHEGADDALVVQSTMDAAGVIRAAIPDAMLEIAADLRAWIVDETTGSRTLHEILVPVNERAKPDYKMEV